MIATIAAVAVVATCAALVFGLWRLSPPRRLLLLVPQLQVATALRQARVWVSTMLISIAVGAIPTALRGEWGGTLATGADALAPSQGTDSWVPMLQALRSLIDHPGVPVYDAVWESYKFQYPLMSLLPLDPFVRLMDVGADPLIASLNVLSWVAFLATGAATAVLWARLHSPHDVPFRQAVPGRSLAVLVPLGIAGALAFYPLTRGIALGQIQTIVALFAVSALLAWQSDRKALAGVLLGLCCIIKPQWAIIAIWGLLRRQWRFVLGGAVTASVAFVLSIIVYGADQVFGYVALLLRIGSAGEVFFTNQSMNGLLNRVLSNGDSLVFSSSTLPPENAVVSAGTLISTVVILGLALAWRVRSTPTILDLAIVIVSLTIAAPVAWEHHYGVMYAVFAVLMVAQFHAGPPGRVLIALTGIAYVLISQDLFVVANRFADSWLSVAQSYMYLAGLLLLVLLCIQSSRSARTVVAAAERMG